jgi:hypothetical protein
MIHNTLRKCFEKMRCVIGFCTSKWYSIRTRFYYASVLECKWLCYPSKWLRCLTCPLPSVQHRTQGFGNGTCTCSQAKGHRKERAGQTKILPMTDKDEMDPVHAMKEGGWSAVEIQIQSLYLETGWQSAAFCLGRFTLGNRHPLIRRLGGPQNQLYSTETR